MGASSTTLTPPTGPKASEIAPANTLLPWKAQRINIRPYPDMWSFNPSIHFDGETWRMIVRCADYAMPGSVQIRGPNADRLGVQNRNVMVHLDPRTWKVIQTFPMRELDGYPRNQKAGNRGYEDMRLFRNELWGLQAIACSAHLERGGNEMFPPEQVLLTLDPDTYDITAAKPIRGDDWSGAQKNWSPFDEAEEPRFLFSIDRGMVFGENGPIEVDPDAAETTETGINAPLPAPGPAPGSSSNLGAPAVDAAPAAGPPRRYGALPVNGVEFRPVARLQAVEARQVGRRLYGGLRGGSQLHYVGDNEWLSIAHEARLERNAKFYWHTFYTCDSNGRLLKTSPPMKLVTERIEFAAGMAIDGDRVVVSLGIDDAECALGVTRLDAVMELLRPYTPPEDVPVAPVPRRLTVGTSSTPIRNR